MLSIRLGSFCAYLSPSTSPSLQLSPDERLSRSSGFPRCLSHLKKPRTSRKSSSGSWLPFRTTSTLSDALFLPVSIHLGSFFAYLGPSTSQSPQPSPDERDNCSSGFLRRLSHLKHPQTSRKSSSGS